MLAMMILLDLNSELSQGMVWISAPQAHAGDYAACWPQLPPASYFPLLISHFR